MSTVNDSTVLLKKEAQTMRMRKFNISFQNPLKFLADTITIYIYKKSLTKINLYTSWQNMCHLYL